MYKSMTIECLKGTWIYLIPSNLTTVLMLS